METVTSELNNTVVVDAAMAEYILVIDSPVGGVKIKHQLKGSGYKVLMAATAAKAIQLYKNYPVSMIFISMTLPDTGAVDLVRKIKHKQSEYKDSQIAAIVVLTDNQKDKDLQACMAAGANDFIIKPFTDNVLLARIKALEQFLEINKVYGAEVEEQKTARNIFDAAIEARNIEIKGMRIHSQAASIFCGDMALTSKHPDGDIYVLFADLTGHGLSAAIGVLPVSDMFSNLTQKGKSAEDILQQVNQQLLCLLPTGMFMACCMLKINLTEKTVSVWNAGMPDIYIVDRYIKTITKRFTSTAIPLGITKLQAKDINFESVNIKASNNIIMLSDGFTDSMNETGGMFGIRRFESILEKNLADDNLFKRIVDTFILFKGNSKPRDDVTLISIPFKEILNANENSQPTILD